MKFAKAIAAIVLVAGLAGHASAGEITPVGNWQTTTGESRFAISLCGDGSDLCARLTWLRADAQSPENMVMLNKLVVQAAPVEANKWVGTVNYDGHTVDGSVTLVSQNKLQISGCQLILCKQVDFVRL